MKLDNNTKELIWSITFVSIIVGIFLYATYNLLTMDRYKPQAKIITVDRLSSIYECTNEGKLGCYGSER